MYFNRSSEKLKLQFQSEEADTDLRAFYQEKARLREELQREKRKVKIIINNQLFSHQICNINMSCRT